MSLFSLKKTVVAVAIGIMIMVVGSSNASAQSRREIERERQRIERENAQYERERQRQQGRSSFDRGTPRWVTNANFQQGYTYGYLAGASDRRRGKYNRSNVYRDTPVGPFAGDPTNTDYIYRQGYLAGYNDGFNGRRNY